MGNDNQDDFDWLYRREPRGDHTQIMRPEESSAQVTSLNDHASDPSAQQPWQRDHHGQDQRVAQTRTHSPDAYPPPHYPTPSDPTAQHAHYPTPQRDHALRPAQTAANTATSAARPPVQKRKVLKRTIFGLTTLFVAWVIFMIAVPVITWNGVRQVNAMPSGQRPASRSGTLTLLVGSDSREGLTSAERKKYGTGSTSGKRTDTMMLLFRPNLGKPALISLPRDSYLTIPGKGKSKLNAAYAWGGPALLIKTIELNTGLHIDNYLEIGFSGIVKAVDAVGGVQVCLKAPIKDRDSHLDLPKGCQRFDGATALNYVRMRKADPRGDLGRVQRQRQLISLIVKKALDPKLLLNPFAYLALNNAAGSSLVRDKDTSVLEALTVARSFQDISSGKGYQLTVPVANANAQTPAGSSVLWNHHSAKEMFSIIASGTTSGLDQFVK